MLLAPRTVRPITAGTLDLSIETEQQSVTVGVVRNDRESMRKALDGRSPIAIAGPLTGINNKQLGTNRSSKIDLLFAVLLIHAGRNYRMASHKSCDNALVADHGI